MNNKRQKLVLINPHPAGRHGEEDIRVIVQMPLNLAYVAAHTPDHWDVDLVDETVEDALDAQGNLKFDADLVGVTCLTYQAPRAYEILAAARRKGIPTVMGGIHATTATEEALSRADAVIVAEAEGVWRRLLADLENGQLQPLYEGGFPELDYLSTYPRRELLTKKYGYKYSSIITTKGCPWRCSFCSVPMSQGQVYRERDVEDVIDEMEATPFKGLMFAEDNFYGYKPESNERARRLFRRMVERGVHKDWFGFTQLSTGHDVPALRDMAESGCLGFLVGLESTDEQVLRRLAKGSNIKTGVENYDSAIRNIHDAGMIVWASVIWGADYQTKEHFYTMAEYCLENSIDVLTFGVHTPFPKTPVHRRLVQENRIFRDNFPRDWLYYDTAHITHTLSHMTLDECIEGMEHLYSKLYGAENLRQRFVKTLKANGSRRTAMFAYKVGTDWDRVFRQVISNMHELRDSGLYERTMHERDLALST